MKDLNNKKRAGMLDPRGVAFTEAVCEDSVSAVFLNKGYQMSLHLPLNLK